MVGVGLVVQAKGIRLKRMRAGIKPDPTYPFHPFNSVDSDPLILLFILPIID
jgi:hypothetical protein